MLLRKLMTTPVLKVSPGQTASDALASMRDENVRHAVVVLGSTIVGVVSDRDLGGPNGALARLHHQVGDLMHRDPIVAPPDMRVEEAVHLVRERHIGCLPIVEKGQLVGIVTRSDLLRLSDPRSKDEQPPVARHEDDDEERPPVFVMPSRDWP
jgi:acetoin utilization protein AcuB